MHHNYLIKPFIDMYGGDIKHVENLNSFHSALEKAIQLIGEDTNKCATILENHKFHVYLKEISKTEPANYKSQNQICSTVFQYKTIIHELK